MGGLGSLRAMLNRTGLTRDVWRDALAAWAGQRVFLLALLLLWQSLLHSTQRSGSGWNWNAAFQPWVIWDGRWYVAIARGGYSALPRGAFFPLFPLLERITSPLVGGHMSLAGLVVANVAALVAVVCLRAFVEQEFDAVIARRTLFIMVCFPASMYLVAAYTESLFLALSVAAFWATRRRLWLVAGCCIALATLTRSAGVLLVLPLLWEAFQALRSGAKASARGQRQSPVFAQLGVAVALPALSLGAWEQYLDQRLGIAHAVTAAADSPDWQRHLSWPWEGIVRDAVVETQRVSAIVRIEVTRDLLFTGAWIALAIAMLVVWRSRSTLSFTLYTWASLALVLALPMHESPSDGLNAMPRYMLVVFPCFILLAQVSLKSPELYRAVCVCFLLALALLMAFFATRLFVA